MNRRFDGKAVALGSQAPWHFAHAQMICGEACRHQEKKEEEQLMNSTQ
jgi:hypothetical protein